jgi:hypothetical protein
MGGPAAVLASGRGPVDALAEAQSLRAKCIPSLKYVADGASDRRAEYPNINTRIIQVNWICTLLKCILPPTLSAKMCTTYPA